MVLNAIIKMYVNKFREVTMERLGIVFDIESNDDYLNAKSDVIKAMGSISKLNEEQRKRLAAELFGIARVEAVMNFISNMNFSR